MEQGFSFFNQWLSYLELAAISTGVIAVWLTIKQKVWCFPVGMINVALYAYLFFYPSIRLYADASLQITYFVLLIFGWYNWSKHGKAGNKVIPGKTARTEWLALFAIAAISIPTLGYFLDSFTNADLPWADSSLTVLSLIAQWMIAKKKIENWILWIIVDLFYLPMYISKGLPLTAILYFIFLVLAIKGFKEWKKNMA